MSDEPAEERPDTAAAAISAAGMMERWVLYPAAAALEAATAMRMACFCESLKSTARRADIIGEVTTADESMVMDGGDGWKSGRVDEDDEAAAGRSLGNSGGGEKSGDAAGDVEAKSSEKEDSGERSAAEGSRSWVPR